MLESSRNLTRALLIAGVAIGGSLALSACQHEEGGQQPAPPAPGQSAPGR